MRIKFNVNAELLIGLIAFGGLALLRRRKRQ